MSTGRMLGAFSSRVDQMASAAKQLSAAVQIMVCAGYSPLGPANFGNGRVISGHIPGQ
jgi:CO dehydrogenase/acetyl-CoA synthase epsilon subunit